MSGLQEGGDKMTKATRMKVEKVIAVVMAGIFLGLLGCLLALR